MSWRDVAIGLGRLMESLGRSRQPRDGSVAFRGMWVGGFATSAVLLFGLSAGAGDSYPAPGFFADGLTAQSTWAEIQAEVLVSGGVSVRRLWDEVRGDLGRVRRGARAGHY